MRRLLAACAALIALACPALAEYPGGYSAPPIPYGACSASNFVISVGGSGITCAQPAVTDISGLGAGVATFLATPSSANLRAALTDESGTGAAVFQGGNIGAATATSINFGDQSLSAYKAGAWTPTLVGAGTAGTPTYTVQVGSYEQIGRMVMVRFNVATTALGGATGSMQLGGLPITSNATSNDFGMCQMIYQSGVTFDAGFSILTGLIGSSVTIALFKESGTSNSQNIDSSKFAAATQIIGSCVYHN